MYAQEDDNKDFEVELEHFQRGYLHAMDDVQRKIQLRNIYVADNKVMLNPNEPSRIQKNTNKRKENKKNKLYIKSL